MSILDRFSDIIKANINELLDKAEDPGKMVDQYLRELTDDLAKVRQETAGVMAQETRARNMYENNKNEIEKYAGLAKQALQAGNEDDARTFIAKKQTLEEKGESLHATYKVAHENAQKMRQLHDKLVTDIDTLRAKRDAIKAKVAVAKTQQDVNKVTSGSDKAGQAMAAFDRREQKADDMLNTANAVEELSKEPVDKAKNLEKKYEEAGKTASVDEELAKMKAELGL